MGEVFPDPDGDERTLLDQVLDGYRRRILATLDGLDDRDAARRPLPHTDLTVGGIVKHLARIEDLWFGRTFAGDTGTEPWSSAHDDRDPDWDFHSARGQTVAELRALYETTCERSREVTRAVADLGRPSALPAPEGERVSLRWIYLHMIEETAAHSGHADLLLDALRG